MILFCHSEVVTCNLLIIRGLCWFSPFLLLPIPLGVGTFPASAKLPVPGLQGYPYPAIEADSPTFQG